MKIIVLFGSPNVNGSTKLLVKQFEKGAIEAGHSVEIFDVTKMNIHPCVGCVACGWNGPCEQKDDMEKVKKEILASDMLIFATPLYYYGFSAQLKIVIDRFCAMNDDLQEKNLKSALISVAWNNDAWTFEALENHYKALVRYLQMQDKGMILGKGCGTPSMTANSKYMQDAYKFGKSL